MSRTQTEAYRLENWIKLVTTSSTEHCNGRGAAHAACAYLHTNPDSPHNYTMKPYVLLLTAWFSIVCSLESSLGAELLGLALDSPDSVIPIVNANLSLISQADRKHYTLLLLTSTDEKHSCSSCHTIRKVLGKVSRAWFSEYLASDYLYIAEVDIVDRSNIPVFNFLNLQKVPQLWLIPPSKITSTFSLSREAKLDDNGDPIFGNFDIFLEPHAEFVLSEGSIESQTFQMTDWLGKAISRRITVKQDDAVKKFVLTFTATLTIIVLIKKRGPSFITGVVTKSKVWTLLFFVYLLLVLGGLSFSMIQKVPFLARTAEGKPMYISGGRHYQFGDEMVLVGGVYGLLGAAFVSLVYLGVYKVSPSSAITSEGQRSCLMLVATGALYVFYSVLTSMYLRKEDWYPYHFAKLF